jgi:hypothetical protein
MVKRKVEGLLKDDSTTLRRTRSSGPLLDTQLTLPPVKRTRKALHLVPSPNLSKCRESPKDNNTNKSMTDEDELDLLRLHEVQAQPLSKCRESPKDNDTNKSMTDGDELDLLRLHEVQAQPASPRCVTPTVEKGTGTPRQVMDAVVITTPKSTLMNPQKYSERTPDSPSPSRPRNMNKASPRRLPADYPLPSVKRLPRPLPSHLVPHLHSQKKAALHALQHPPLTIYEASPYMSVFNQLTELVNGTVQRHEGNSCLILGPRGSGKSRVSGLSFDGSTLTPANHYL